MPAWIGWLLLLGLGIALADLARVRRQVTDLAGQVDRMHDHLLMLMDRHGVSPLGDDDDLPL